MKYFVYTHSIDGIIFYVGCGKIRPRKPRSSYSFRLQHERAYAIAKRSTHWKEFVKGRHIVVQIVADGLTMNDAYAKETELVVKYGRIDLGSGSLVNKTDGGNKGKKNCKNECIIRVVQMDLDGNTIKVWNTVKSIQEVTGFLRTNVIKCCRKKQITAYGYKWRYEDDSLFGHIEARCGQLTRRNSFRPELQVYSKHRNTAHSISRLTK
jgi:hypothetical protein